jgi:hypothetical protein
MIKKPTPTAFLLFLCLCICAAGFGQDSTAKKDTASMATHVTPTMTGTTGATTASDPAGTPKKESLSRKQKDSLAKSLTPIEGKAIVYILRPSGFGGLIKMGVSVDSVRIGGTKAGNFLYAILPPGSHIFESRSENSVTLNLVLEAGKIYYIRQQVKMGFAFAETGLQQEDEKQGLKDLKHCDLAKDNIYSN